MSFINELNRRNVIRVGAAYVVTAWLLIQVAETIFPLFGFGDTPARIVVLVLAIGFVPALVLAWVFEWTPDGLRRDADVAPGHRTTRDDARRFDRIIMAVLALALGYFAFDKFVLDPARDAEIAESAREVGRADAIVEAFGDRSIAVLPFTNMSADPEQEYFSDGMAEELLNLLSRYPELRVISRSSSFTYKGEQVPKISTIALELGVNYIIEGSVRRAGDTVRITAQLIEARSDRHLWSNTYDRQLADIFAVQDEISAAIVGELETALGLEVSGSPSVQAPANTEAYEALLRGRYLKWQRTRESMAGAIEELTRAVTLDPDYALAHAELSLAVGLSFGYGVTGRSEANALALAHAQKALELDPMLAEAHAAMGSLASSEQEATTYYRRAIELNPGYAEVYIWLSKSVSRLFNYAEGFELTKKAAQLDPLFTPAKTNWWMALAAKGRLEEAQGVLETLSSINYGLYIFLMSQHRSIGGHWADAAMTSLEGMEAGVTDAASELVVYLALMGLEREALANPEAMGFEDRTREQIQQSRLFILPILGRPDEAVAAWQPRWEFRFANRMAYAHALAGAAEFSDAGPLLESAWERIGGRLAFFPEDARFVLALMAVREHAENVTDHSVLINALQERVQAYADAGIVWCQQYWVCVDFDAGVLAYLEGDRARGLELIAQSVDEGFFILPNQAYLQFLYDDPGFAPILEKQRQHQARERTKFLAVVCTDNPYQAVWQPAEGTCATFRAAE